MIENAVHFIRETYNVDKFTYIEDINFIATVFAYAIIFDVKLEVTSIYVSWQWLSMQFQCLMCSITKRQLTPQFIECVYGHVFVYAYRIHVQFESNGFLLVIVIINAKQKPLAPGHPIVQSFGKLN